MIAFDTNLLVRLAVNDDQTQAAIAEQLLDNNQVFISRTVLLETEWVLRSVYKTPRSNIFQYFETLLATKNIIVENSAEVSRAIVWSQTGADFADAMHLCICGKSTLHTFDAAFCKTAREINGIPEITVL